MASLLVALLSALEAESRSAPSQAAATQSPVAQSPAAQPPAAAQPQGARPPGKVPGKSGASRSAAGKDACHAGQGLYAAGDVLKAIASLERCLEKEPRNREGWTTLATARLEAGRFPGAADAFARAHALGPGDARFLASYLDALEGAGRAGERIPVLRGLVEADMEDNRHAERLLTLLDSLGPDKHSDDRIFVLEHLGQNPGAPLHHQEKLAALYLARGMLDRSQAEYRGLLSRRPENGEYWAGLAASIAEEDREAALECYRKAMLYTDQAGLRARYEKKAASLKAPRTMASAKPDAPDAHAAPAASPATPATTAASPTVPAVPAALGSSQAPSATHSPAPSATHGRAATSAAAARPSSAPSTPAPHSAQAKAAPAEPAKPAEPAEPAKPAQPAPSKPFDIKAYQDSVFKVELQKRLAALKKSEAATAPGAASSAPSASTPSVSTHPSPSLAKGDREKADREMADKERADKERQEKAAKAEKEKQEQIAKAVEMKAREDRERFVKDSLAEVEKERLARLEAERKARERHERRDRAIAHYRGGRLDSADALFRTVLAESPDPDVFYYAGRTQMDKGRHAKALELLTRSPKDMPGLDAWLGRAYQATGKPKEALEAFERQFAKSQAAEILEEICSLRKSAPDPAPWAACLEQLLEKRPKEARYHEQLAEHYRRRNDKAKEMEHYSRLLILEPAHGEASYRLGLDWSGQGVHDRAVPLLEKAVAAHPGRGAAWKALAVGQAALGRKDQAWESYRKAAALLPEDTEVARGRLALASEPGRDSSLGEACQALLKLVPEDAGANMGYARLRFQARDFAAAERHFRIACRDSKDARAWGQFGRALLEMRKPGEAAPALQKALDLGDSSMSLRLDLARLRLDLGDADKAEALMKAISAQSPSDPEPYYWLGRIAGKRQQVAVQEEFLRKANQLRPGDPRYAESVAALYRDRDECRQAVPMLNHVEPNLSSGGRMLLGDCLASSGEVAKALEIYSALFRKEPSAVLLSRRIDALVRIGKAGEAADAARGTAFGSSPEVRFSLAKAHLSLAESHVLKGDLDLAVSLLKAALDADGHRPEYHFHLGMAWYRKGRLGKARAAFTDALRYRVDYPEAVYWKGLCLVEDGEAQEARAFFTELAQHADPRWKAKGLSGLARVFETEGKWEAVEHHLVKSITTHPEADAMAFLSRVQLKLGRFPESEDWARKALALEGSHEAGTLALAEALAARKRLPEALGLAESALRMKPLSCGLLEQAAKLNLEAGRLDSTLIATGRAIQACPQEPMPHFYAAMACRGANRPEDAKRHFKSFRKLGGDKKLIPE